MPTCQVLTLHDGTLVSVCPDEDDINNGQVDLPPPPGVFVYGDGLYGGGTYGG